MDGQSFGKILADSIKGMIVLGGVGGVLIGAAVASVIWLIVG